MPSSWLKNRRREHYYRKAKDEKYRSRASYKLLEMAGKYNFLKEGDVVVDLGAAPGGWLQAARKIVGNNGFVLGVDLYPIKPMDEVNIHIIVGDISDQEITKQIKNILPSKADVVISDVAPNVSGVWEVDHARQIGLARCSLTIAIKIMRVGGNLFVKAFQGDLFNNFIREVKVYFRRVKIVKPKASRPQSAEVFVLGLHLKKQASA
ncbi:MAG: RlmE family RNA methyltransferase [Candidatus Bathyarchaeota archaeon]|nr:MAG: RlmE family RNA methyltransferase [Candidatus Bathyarchaeota archaeon]